MYARKIAEKIKNINYDELPSDVVQRSKELILDTIGVALAGSLHNSADIYNEYVDEIGGQEEATIIGRNKKNSVVNAALVNSAIGHTLEFDDISWSIIGHPAVVTVFPAISMGEKYNSSGKKVLSAIVAGYEVIASIGRGLVPDLVEKGWHSTSAIGTFGAAAAAGIICDLSVDEMVNALGIAGSLASGVKANLGTMTKDLHAGHASSSGITAALLAKKGFTANEKIFEAKNGYCSIYSPKFDLDIIVDSFCNPFDLITNGALFKKWPSCACTHPFVEAIITLAEENNISPEKVEKIEIYSTPCVVDTLFYDNPKTDFEAKFSSQFCAALALVKRRVYLEDFTDKVINDPIIKKIMGTVTLDLDPEIDPDSYVLPPEEGILKTRVAITMKDNSKFYKEIPFAKGDVQRRLSMEEIIEKYRSCAGLVLKDDKLDKSIEAISNLEKIDNISTVMNILS